MSHLPARTAATIITIISALVSTVAVAAFHQAGIASTYGPNDRGGRFGPTGERINHTAFTAAHKTLPLGTLVEVINKRNGRAAVVKITDRGPYVRGRIIDLTQASGKVLGVHGLDPVRIRSVPEHGCTFAERFGAGLVAGQLLAHGRDGCPLASGETDKGGSCRAAGCAFNGNGQAAAAPQSNPMNWRRLIASSKETRNQR